jgi:hypothetical protein
MSTMISSGNLFLLVNRFTIQPGQRRVVVNNCIRCDSQSPDIFNLIRLCAAFRSLYAEGNRARRSGLAFTLVRYVISHKEAGLRTQGNQRTSGKYIRPPI